MTDDHSPDPDMEPVEAIYDALEYGDPETALLLARRALTEDDPQRDDPVLHFLAGVALLEMDRPVDAVAALQQASKLDPDDAEFRARLSEALFASCRFDEAEREARQATESDSRLPHGHWMLGLLLERAGRYEEADGALFRAAALAPDEFCAPIRLDREEFDAQLRTAIDALPDRFSRHLEDVAVTVEDLPSDELLRAEDPPLNPELLGLFDGTARGDDSVFSPGGELPPRIHLFQRNIERFAHDAEELREEIGVTLRHELGHYLGLDEEEIARAGHA